MAVFFVDPSHGDNANAGTSASEAFATIEGVLGDTSATYDNPHIVWIRRASTQTLSGNVAIDDSGLFVKFIGWPSAGEPMYAQRPQAGIDAGWDDDELIKPTIDCNGHIIGTTSDHAANIYIANCSLTTPNGDYTILNVAGGSVVLENIEADHSGRRFIYWDGGGHDITFVLRQASLHFRKDDNTTLLFEASDNRERYQHSTIECTDVNLEFDGTSGPVFMPGRYSTYVRMQITRVTCSKSGDNFVLLGDSTDRGKSTYLDLMIRESQIACNRLYNVYFYCEASCSIIDSSINCGSLIYLYQLYPSQTRKRIDLELFSSSVVCTHILEGHTYTYNDVVGKWSIVDSNLTCSAAPFFIGSQRTFYLDTGSRIEGVTLTTTANFCERFIVDLGKTALYFNQLQLASVNNTCNGIFIVSDLNIDNIASDIALVSLQGEIRNGATAGHLQLLNTQVGGDIQTARCLPGASITTAALCFSEMLQDGASITNGTHFFAKLNNQIVSFGKFFNGTVALNSDNPQLLECTLAATESYCGISLLPMDVPANASVCTIFFTSDTPVQWVQAVSSHIDGEMLCLGSAEQPELIKDCKGVHNRYCLHLHTGANAEITLLLKLDETNSVKHVAIDQNLQWS